MTHRFKAPSLYLPAPSPLTRQLSRGDGLRVQPVGVLQPHQGLGCPRLVVIIGEVLSLDGQVGDEPWSMGRKDWKTQFYYTRSSLKVVQMLKDAWRAILFLPEWEKTLFHHFSEKNATDYIVWKK